MRRCELSRGRILLVLLGLALLITVTSAAAPAQEVAPRVEFTGTYSWLKPGGRLANVAPAATVADVPDVPAGWGASATYNFNKWFGATADFGGHYHDFGSVHTFTFGPTVKFRSPHFSPFVEALFGVGHISPSSSFFAVPVSSQTGFAAALGGGIDVPLTQHFGLRLIQADWVRQDYSRNNSFLDTGTLNGVRVQAGLMLSFGQVGKPLPPPTASCSVKPAEVQAGEPVQATVATQNFNPKHKLTYDWKSTGGKVSGQETTASVDTTGLAPGNYNVTATVTDPRKSKNGTATCNAAFTVKQPQPPTISCSANPTTVRAGEPSTITATASSPDNRPVTLSWTSSAGRVSGTGNTATLDTTGAAGPITVTGTATDDRGLSTTCAPTVNVEAPPAAPAAVKSEIAFPNLKKPARVDNTAKAILDDVALRMQRDPDSKAVVVGYFDATEKGGVKLAQERAVNTKAYLTAEKGIDPARIEVRTGTAGGKRAEIYVVPAGATFDATGTQTFPEKPMKPAAKKAAKKPAAKKAPAAPAAAPKP